MIASRLASEITFFLLWISIYLRIAYVVGRGREGVLNGGARWRCYCLLNAFHSTEEHHFFFFDRVSFTCHLNPNLLKKKARKKNDTYYLFELLTFIYRLFDVHVGLHIDIIERLYRYTALLI